MLFCFCLLTSKKGGENSPGLVFAANRAGRFSLLSSLPCCWEPFSCGLSRSNGCSEPPSLCRLSDTFPPSDVTAVEEEIHVLPTKRRTDLFTRRSKWIQKSPSPWLFLSQFFSQYWICLLLLSLPCQRPQWKTLGDAQPPIFRFLVIDSWPPEKEIRKRWSISFLSFRLVFLQVTKYINVSCQL